LRNFSRKRRGRGYITRVWKFFPRTGREIRVRPIDFPRVYIITLKALCRRMSPRLSRRTRRPRIPPTLFYIRWYVSREINKYIRARISYYLHGKLCTPPFAVTARVIYLTWPLPNDTVGANCWDPSTRLSRQNDFVAIRTTRGTPRDYLTGYNVYARSSPRQLSRQIWPHPGFVTRIDRLPNLTRRRPSELCPGNGTF